MNRKLWAVTGLLVISLLILLLLGSAASAVLFALPPADHPSMTSALGLTGLLLSAAGCLLATVLSIAVVLKAVRRKIRRAQDWPATTGLVLVSEVRDAGGDGGWHAKIVYRYEVGGHVYEGSRIAFAVEHGDQSYRAQEQLAARFPAGARVPVYYDPEEPADAALLKGDPNSTTPSLY